MPAVSRLADRPVPAVATAGFLLALLATGAYYAGLVPGVPKTLPTFAKLASVTVGTFVIAVVAWIGSGLRRRA